MKRKPNHRVRLIISLILGLAATLNLVNFVGRVERNDDPSNPPQTAKTEGTSTRQIDTTIIITSSLIPSHPSLVLIDQTIESLNFIEGISKDTPIIITVDGAYPTNRGPDAAKTQILREYTAALEQKYGTLDHVTILSNGRNIKLVGNVQKALKLVKTEFIYLIQHDMPFISAIDHIALVNTFHHQSHQQAQVRLVRFSPRKTLTRNRDRIPGVCNEDEIELQGANDIHLSKTHTWSDNNHFTTRSYYEEMFTTIKGWDGTRYMEEKMKVLGLQNCSYWGTYLYGAIGDGPMIIHRDGRNFESSSITTT